MKIFNIAFLLALLSTLCAQLVRAENIAIPDNDRRQEMSYEEYSNYRNKMRMQMEKTHPDKSNKTQEATPRSAEQIEKSKPEGTYGQGYHLRNRAEDKPDSAANNKPDRPHFERFNRSDMMRR